MNANYQAINEALEAVRKRRLLLLRARVLLIALAAVLAAGILTVLLLPSLGGPARLVLRVVLLAGLFGPLLAGAAVAIRKKEGLDEAARAVERANPQANNELINAIQLTRAQAAGGVGSYFSGVLLNRHLEATARLLPSLETGPAASAASLKPWPLTGAALGVVLVALLLAMPQRFDRGFAALFADPWSNPQKERISALPLTAGDFSLVYRYPAYSRLPEQKVPNSSGDIAALKGTSVLLETSVLEPLKSAALVTSAGARYEMKVEGKTRLSVELVVLESGAYHLEGVDTRGEPRSETATHRIVADEDLAPTIVLLEPAADIEVAVEGTLDVSYEAGDDFGLSRVELVFEHGGEQRRVSVKNMSEPGWTRDGDFYVWFLSEEKFSPGDAIPFWLEAVDNDEVAGGKTGRSETRTLTIYSARKNHQALLARQDELMDMMIDHLGLHLDSWLKAKKDPAQMGEDEKTLLDDANRLLAYAQALLSDLYLDELADELTVSTLESLTARYAEKIQVRGQLLDKDGKVPAPARDKLALYRADFRKNLENDILYFDKLIKKQRLDDLLAQSDDLYKAQSQLADLLAQYKKTGDPALLDKLNKALAELESAFANLMQQMAKMRKGLPDEFVNADAMKNKNFTDLASQMEKLKKALNSGDMENALGMAEDFLAKMGQWMAMMEKDAGDYGQMISRETLEELETLEQDLDKLIGRQSEVENELAQLNQQAAARGEQDAKQREAAREGAREAIDDLRESLQRTQQSFIRMRPGMRNGGAPAPLTAEQNQERMGLYNAMGVDRFELTRIDNAIEQGDFATALELARELKQRMEKNREQTSSFAGRTQAGPDADRREFDQSWQESTAAMDKLIKDLEKLERSSSGNPTPEEKARMRQLADEEQAIREEVRGLRERYETVREDAPSLPGEPSQALERGETRIDDASGECKLGNAGRAQTPAAEGRAHLESARDGMKQSREQMGQQMMPGPGGMRMGQGGPGGKRGGDQGPNNPKADVKVPGADEHQVPEEYRQEILKAMKESAPEEYQNLNRDYYERLVK